MEITLVLYNGMEKKKVYFENPQGETIGHILTLLGIDQNTNVIVISGGQVLSPADRIMEEMEIKIFPVMEGG